jgi:hypothetical protein
MPGESWNPTDVMGGPEPNKPGRRGHAKSNCWAAAGPAEASAAMASA